MNLLTFQQFCKRFPGVTEEFPFDRDTLVYKVMGRMFVLGNINPFVRINFKSTPEEALLLRESYPDYIIPGYHMHKKHWNRVYLDRGLPLHLLEKWIKRSYDLVCNNLPKKVQKELKGKK